MLKKGDPIDATIVIILYKNLDDLSANERASLERCILIFGLKRKFYFVVNEELYWERYERFFLERQLLYQFENFPEWFFYNTQNYNQLMFHKEFYRLFDNTNYILIYQLDCWVFYDDLDKWLDESFDYIGSPFFQGFCRNTNFQFTAGGNGGFSLRNVRKQSEILNYLYELKAIYVLDYRNDCSRKIDLFRESIEKVRIKSFESVVSLFEMPDLNEDYIWSVLIPKVFVDFKVCPPDDALNFSMEMHPRLLYEMNNCRLPMGVHAWEKYDWEFWRNFIKY